MACNVHVTIKIIELMLCVACIVYKRVSDDEGGRLRTRQEKQNYEWPLLRFITWEQNGSSYADITYGSYVLITAGLLIGYLSGELTKGRNMESFLLGFGALLFIAVGSLELAALDSVPEELIDNAAILGVVSLLTGGLFLLDLGLSGKRRKQENLKLKLKHLGPSKLTQTDEKSGYDGAFDLFSHKINGLISNGNSKSLDQIDKNDKVVGQLKSSLKGKKTDGETMRVTFPSDILNPPSDIVPPSEPNGGLRRTPKDSGDYNKDWEKQPDNMRASQKLRRGDIIPKLPRTPSRTLDESDADDSLALPTVSFIMREKGDFGSQSSLRSKSPSLRTQMLPMMPVETPREEPALRTARQLDKSLSQPELGKSSKIQRYDSDSEIPHEIVVMSPSEKSEFMAYKKIMKNLADHPQNITMLPDISTGDFNPELKATYSTEEIIEPRSQISSPAKSLSTNNQNRASKSKPKPKPKSSQSERPKGYVEQQRDDKYPREFSEDISHMTPSERERYLFGESPKQKDSKPVSPMMEERSPKKTSGSAAHPPASPDADAHWRFDSRDANLGQSFRKSPRDSRESPSSPMDPGYVLHTAHNWPQSTPHSTPKTPSQSPSDVASGASPKTPYRISSDESDTNAQAHYAQASHRMRGAPPPPPAHTHPALASPPQTRSYFLEEDESDRGPGGGSLTTQLLQKWIKQRHTKVTKMRSDP